MRRARMPGKNVQDHLAVLDSSGIDLVAENDFFTVVMDTGPEHELTVPLGPIDAPSGEGACDLLNVFLCVASINTECVQLHQFAAVVFIDALQGGGKKVVQ